MNIELNGLRVMIDEPIEISVPLRFDATQSYPFGIQHPRRKRLFDLQGEDRGCICDEISFCPHTHTTHVESAAHVDPKTPSTLNILRRLPPLLTALLVDAPLCKQSNQIAEALLVDNIKVHCTIEKPSSIDALILRTGSVSLVISSFSLGFSFITTQTLSKINELCPALRVLLIDSVSIDPENDNGQLLAHRSFLLSGVPNDRLVVELCHLPHSITPGVYALSLNAAAFDASDAIPCRPVIYSLSHAR